MYSFPGFIVMQIDIAAVLTERSQLMPPPRQKWDWYSLGVLACFAKSK